MKELDSNGVIQEKKIQSRGKGVAKMYIGSKEQMKITLGVAWGLVMRFRSGHRLVVVDRRANRW